MKKIDWEKVDYSKPTKELAEELGCSRATVTRHRRVHAKETRYIGVGSPRLKATYEPDDYMKLYDKPTVKKVDNLIRRSKSFTPKTLAKWIDVTESRLRSYLYNNRLPSRALWRHLVAEIVAREKGYVDLEDLLRNATDKK